jgi:GLPGLI family protein
MVLFINPNNSLFESENQYLRDSAAVADAAANRFGSMSFVQATRTNFQYNIFKESSNQITTIDNTNRERFEYSEPKNSFNWQLLPDTATIDGFHCEKAITKFGGREWIAWFTSEVPINDGPYKFCGLPGLIMKIHDSKNYYVFTLTGLINKLTSVPSLKLRAPIKVSKQEFYSLVKKYKENRFEMDQQHGVTFTSGQDAIKKRLALLAKKNNNPIELVN